MLPEASAWGLRVVEMSVDLGRRRKIVTAMRDALEEDSVCRRQRQEPLRVVIFTFRDGGIPIQGVLAYQCSSGRRDGSDEAMLPSINPRARMFFVAVLPRLPPRRMEMAPSNKAAQILTSDKGASEPGVRRARTLLGLWFGHAFRLAVRAAVRCRFYISSTSSTRRQACSPVATE